MITSVTQRWYRSPRTGQTEKFDARIARRLNRFKKAHFPAEFRCFLIVFANKQKMWLSSVERSDQKTLGQSDGAPCLSKLTRRSSYARC